MVLDALRASADHALVRLTKLPTPDQAAVKFAWTGHLKEGTHYSPQFTEFCQKTQDVLHLQPEEVLDTIKRANELAQGHYEALFDEKSAINKMDYHNADHAQITAITGAKMLLGALQELAQSEQYEHYFRENPKLASQIFRTGVVSFALHEADDWWTLKRDPELVNVVKANLATKLKYLGIDTGDFNRFIKLDAFKDTVDKSVQDALADTPENPFLALTENSDTSIFSTLGRDPMFRKELFTKISRCIRTADFMQVYNPNYRNPIRFFDARLHKVTKTEHGAVTLAIEMQKFRPQALPAFKWNVENTDPVEINWQNVEFGESFFTDFAEPNIDLANKYMAIFDSNEYSRGEQEKAKIKLQFAEKKSPKTIPQKVLQLWQRATRH